MNKYVGKVRGALTGISGVPVTPYGSDGEIDLKLLRNMIQSMARSGVHNIIAAGNTGEFFALSLDEVKAVHQATVEGARGQALVSAAVGRSLTEAKQLTRSAIAQGAGAIMVHQPADPFAAPQAQVRYFLEVAETSTVPVIAYVRSEGMSVERFLELARHPNIAGVKFATTNLMVLAEVVRSSRDLPTVWVCGLAEGWAPPFYSLGARGFTSGLVNVFPKISLAIHAALERGDFQRARQRITEIAAFEAMRTRFANGANVTVVKQALRLLGHDVGLVRAPGLEELDAADHDALALIVERCRTAA